MPMFLIMGNTIRRQCPNVGVKMKILDIKALA